MTPLKAGDKFPDGVEFVYSPIISPDPTACGTPQPYDASTAFRYKTVVLVSIPGTFTPGCQNSHLPPYIRNLDKLKAKGVDLVVVIACNDAYVMNAWGTVNGVGQEGGGWTYSHTLCEQLFMSDTNIFFSKQYGWSQSAERSARWAMIIERDGTVSYAEVEARRGEVKASSAETIMEKL